MFNGYICNPCFSFLYFLNVSAGLIFSFFFVMYCLAKPSQLVFDDTEGFFEGQDFAEASVPSPHSVRSVYFSEIGWYASFCG